MERPSRRDPRAACAFLSTAAKKCKLFTYKYPDTWSCTSCSDETRGQLERHRPATTISPGPRGPHPAAMASIESGAAVQWNKDAAIMVDTLTKSQAQVQELLDAHDASASELDALKTSCAKEVSLLTGVMTDAVCAARLPHAHCASPASAPAAHRPPPACDEGGGGAAHQFTTANPSPRQFIALKTQLEELQEDAWRMEMFAELERMRCQLEMLVPLQDLEEGPEGEEGDPGAQQGSTNDMCHYLYPRGPGASGLSTPPARMARRRGCSGARFQPHNCSCSCVACCGSWQCREFACKQNACLPKHTQMPWRMTRTQPVRVQPVERPPPHAQLPSRRPRRPPLLHRCQKTWSRWTSSWQP